jgi:hypothetical protein
MTRLTVKMVVTYPPGSSFAGASQTKAVEAVVYTIEKDYFDPDCLNVIVPDALNAARKKLGVLSTSALKQVSVEISVALTADGGECRPALHLDVETISLMSEAGAAFDFDPYVY